MVSAVLSRYFDELGLTLINWTSAPDNKRSVDIAGHLGFKHERQLEAGTEDEPSWGGDWCCSMYLKDWKGDLKRVPL